MLLIGGNRHAWAELSPEDWSASVEQHGHLIAELKRTGEFLECNELATTPEGSRIVRQVDGLMTATAGPLHDDTDFASGYYLLNCVDIERAGEVAGQLHESRFAPIEVRQVGE
ncbi:MAG: hypothetical protein ABIS08_03980 [Pseudolysinimonas sp.]